MPKVSIITPTYNRADLVCEAIDSALAQTFTDFELIVVDDGSTDNTEAVIRAIPDPRVRYIKRENGGASAARNTGLAAATGEWIAFLDSDDLYLPERLALQMAEASRSPEAGLIYGAYYSVVSTKEEKRLSGLCREKPLDLQTLLMGPAFHWSTVLIKRPFLEQEGGFDTNFWVGEEWELTLRLALAGCQMVCVPEPLSVARMQTMSLSRDLHKHAASSQGVLDKVYADPRMPKALLSLQKTAQAIRILKFASSAYLAEEPAIGKAFMTQALEIDPSLKRERIEVLASKLTGYVRGLSLGDPEDVLTLISENLPDEKSFAARLRRELWDRYYMDTAFMAYRLGEPQRCRTYAIKAIANNLDSVRNRGLISVLLRSLIGAVPKRAYSNIS